jgi:hypothetical protein
MFIRRKKNRSGTTSVIVVQKGKTSFKEIISKTMIMERHKRIEKLFDDSFWVMQ